jgi:glycosyltransferase involved in cell wall biosynthesis
MPAVREWVDPEGVPVGILTRHSRGRWKHRIFALEVVRELFRKRDRYDIVYFLMQGLQLAAGLPVARFLRKPVVIKIAGSGVISDMRNSRVGRLELGWMRGWKIPVLLLNEGMMEEALAYGLSREQLVWMPNPVDATVFRPAEHKESEEWRALQGVPENARVAIYVGRLSPEKGLTGLLRGFAEAARSSPVAVLLIVGDGPFQSELESLAANLGLAEGRIRFTGRAPISDIPRWLGAADVFALTSPNEGFPCALLEAMAVGLPSVVSAIPANLQLVDDGVHGLTVGWNDPVAIGGAFLRLLGKPELCRAMGAAARERAVANYSTDVVLELYEKVFAGVVGGVTTAPQSRLPTQSE